MGVVNVTPDSFSDGGRFLDFDAALAQARRLVADGADMLDIGGESTRPGAQPVSEAEELARIFPLIEALKRRDRPANLHRHHEARRRPRRGSGRGDNLERRHRARLCAGQPADGRGTRLRRSCSCTCRATPRTMQRDPRYDDVVAEVAAFLEARAQAAMAAGVGRERIWLDPGIGFGKTAEHNLALLAHLEPIVALGFPVVLGVSRKRFIGAIDPSAAARAGDRLGGSLAAALAGARAGVAIVRVHDVRETRQALAVQAAIEAAG